jgi:hypothetical protein
MFSQIPTEIHEQGVAKFIGITDMRNLFLVNKEYNIIMKTKVMCNIQNGSVITYYDIIQSSIYTKIYDKCHTIFSSHCDVDNLDLLFNYTIATKKHILQYMSGNICLDPTKVCCQTKFHNITAASHESIDYRIFQLLAHMSDVSNGKLKEVILTSINIQLIDYCHDLFMDRLKSICSEETFHNIRNIGKQTIETCKKSILKGYMNFNIASFDVNVYNTYYILLSTMLLNKCKKMLSQTVCKTIKEEVLYMLYTKSMCKYVNTEAQIKTIKQFIHLITNDDFKSIKIHLVTMNFSYINYIIQHDIMTPELLNNKIFLSSVLNRSVYIQQILQVDGDKYDIDYVNILNNILEENIRLLT